MAAVAPQKVLSCTSVSKSVFVHNISYENESDVHEHDHEVGTHFHMNGFARRLVLKRRQNAKRE